MPDAPASSTNPSGTDSHPDATLLEDPSDSEGFFCVEMSRDPSDEFKEEYDSGPQAAFTVYSLALENANQWENGRTLTVCFLDGSADLQRRVKEIASEWMRYANIKFQFVEGREAEIRIKFTGKGGPSRSWVGKDNLWTSAEETMALGIEETSLEARIRHVVLHEFGHALGCVHEHMQPNFPLTWNEQVVIDAHKGIWDEDRVRENIFRKYAQDEVQASRFDPESIMLYPIRKGWTTKEGYVTRMNSNLSEIDKEFISSMYPFPPTLLPSSESPPPIHHPPRRSHASDLCGDPNCGKTSTSADCSRSEERQ
ncbi:hypothetical protein BJV74DRAFT_298804 [Russula compacta]|nr:hypothetical protein BJV74DRAFT_298804 [Russula compacta]